MAAIVLGDDDAALQELLKQVFQVIYLQSTAVVRVN